MTKYSFIPILLLSFCSMNCKKEPPIVPPDPKPEIRLTLQDTTCTEAWLQLQFKNLLPPHNYKIYRDTTLAITGTLFANETTFIDEGLLPKKTYSYKAIRFENNSVKDSVTTAITTMDTTSHEINWEIHYFGDYGSNVLYDIAIINENNIWAVGEINLFDSLGQQQSEQYGLVRWDGNEWKVIKLSVLYNLGVQFVYSLLPQAIKAFGPDDIWFANGSVYHWDGDTITTYYVNKFPGNPNPVWTKDRQRARTLGGTSSSNLYASGEEGTLAYFDGVKWKNVEANTNYQGNDIFVDTDVKTGETNIYGLFSEFTPVADSKLFRLTKNNAEQISMPGINTIVTKILGSRNKKYYAVGLGIFVKRIIDDTTMWKNIQPGLTQYATTEMFGSSPNNVFIAGSFGELLHFNGYTWKSFRQHPVLQGITSISSIEVKHKTIVAVGYYQSGAKAFVLVGKQK